MTVLDRFAEHRNDVYLVGATAAAAAACGLAAAGLASTQGIVLTMALLPLAVVHYVVAVRRYGLLSPDGLFFASQLLMACGTFYATDGGSAVDDQYATIVVAATVAYIAASLITYSIMTRGRRLEKPTYKVTVFRFTPSTRWPLVISIVIVLAYFSAVGYSAFFVGLQGQIDGTPADVASLRLASYAGGRYLFPGYVNQFKNAILPALAVVFATWAMGQRSLRLRVTAGLLLAFAALGLLWTGQRGAFVAFLITAGVYALLYNRRRLSRWMLVIPAVGLPLMLVATIVNARGDSATGGVLERFVHDNQASGIAGFRYTYPRPTQWGAEWGLSIRGLLPGELGSPLSSEIFATVYGSTRGTAPPSLWGSVHYNFGEIGVLIFAVLLGVIIQRWTCRSLRATSYNTLQLVGIAGVTVTVGTWIADGPTALLNAGIAGYAGLAWWGGRIARSEAKQVEPTSPASVTTPARTRPART